jgi:hypothetical protein
MLVLLSCRTCMRYYLLAVELTKFQLKTNIIRFCLLSNYVNIMVDNIQVKNDSAYTKKCIHKSNNIVLIFSYRSYILSIFFCCYIKRSAKKVKRVRVNHVKRKGIKNDAPFYSCEWYEKDAGFIKL